MNCINIKSAEFKALAQTTGIPEYELDFKIAKWQEENNSFEFPTSEELISINSEVLEKLNSFEMFKDLDKLCPNGICNVTARDSTDYLKSIGVNPYPANYNGSQLPVKVKTPLSDFKIEHYVSAVAINGAVYIYDMPQHEFISNEFFGYGSSVNLKETYKPRLIPLTIDEIQANYDLDKKDAGKFIFDILTNKGWEGADAAPSFKDYIKLNIKNSEEYINLLESEILNSEYEEKNYSAEDYLEAKRKIKESVLKAPLTKKEQDKVVKYYENKLKIKSKEYLPKKTDKFSIVTLVNSILGKIYENRLDLSSFDNALSSLEDYLKSKEFLKDLLDKHQNAKDDLESIDKLFDKVYKKAQLMAGFTRLVKTYGIEGSLKQYDISTQYEIRSSLPSNILEKYVSKEQAAFMLNKYWGNKDNIVKNFNIFKVKSYNDLVLARFKAHSIYNKYNTVLNFLKSSDFDASYLYKVIANEAIRRYKYFEKIGQPQYLQIQSSKIKPEFELDIKIKDFLSKIGVDIESVSTLKDSEGNPITGIALANLLDKVIQVVEGKAGIDTLPEEAAHFFVEMLPKDSHLFTTMYNQIDKYGVYQEVLNEYGEDPEYKGNLDKLRKEAMGKLIAQHIVTQYKGEESEVNIDKANKWWNAIWKWITAKFKMFNKEGFYNTAKEYNAFSDAANRILTGNVSSLAYSNIEDASARFFQKETDAAKQIRELIEAKNADLIYDTDKEQYFRNVNNITVDVKNRVSDRTKAPEGKFAERSEAEKIQDEKSRKLGVQVHKALNNINTRAVEKINNSVKTATDKFNLSDDTYSKLEQYVTNLMKSYPPGSIFLSETMIYSGKADEAGTIDLIVINPDGKVDLYDWKTINLYGKDTIPFYKEENWNVQLSRYKGILKEYGVKNFGKLRVIPISTKWNKKGDFIGIDIGGNKLEEIPMTGLKGGEIEQTGIESIDSLISVLVGRMKKVMELKIPYEDVKRKQLQIERIERFKASIKELQLRQSFDKFLEDALFEMNLIKNTGLENMTLDQLKDAKDIVSFYSRMVSEGYIEETATLKEQFGQFSKVQTSASVQLRNINKEIEKRIIQAAEGVGINNLLDPQKEIGFWGKMFRSISQSEHPVIQISIDLS
jgi:hypothetical protein